MYQTGGYLKIAGEKCEECPLRGRPVVPGYGNEEADVVLVGEAPGENEVKRGKPFVGRSGQLLNTTLEKVGIDRDSLWVTNTCLCHPVDNRDPNKEEIASCHDRLVGEIKEVNPSIIVVMGNVALHTLTGKKGITKHIGAYEYSEEFEAWIVYSLHPAAGLRRPGWKQDLETAFHLVKSLLEDKRVGEEIEVNYEVIDQPEDFKLPPSEKPVIDLEWSSNEEILCMGVGDEDMVYVYDREVLFYPEVVEQLTEYIRTHPISGQNFKSDVGVMSRDKEIGLPVFTKDDNWFDERQSPYSHDTMLMSYAIDPRKGIHGLKVLAKRFLHVGEYDAEIKPYIREMENCPKDLMYKYNAMDVCYNALLRDRLLEEMNDRAGKLYYNRLMPAARALCSIEVRGTAIDRLGLAQLDREFENKLSRMEQEIYGMAGEEFNINSHQQLADILYDKMELPIPVYRKVNKEAFAMLEKYHPIIPTLQEYKALNKMQGTYVHGIQKKIRGSKLHTNFNIHITATGRLSSSGPNLQNIPTRSDLGRKIKKMFIPSRKNLTLYEYDYSQAELRVLAYLSGDETLLDAFHQDKDIHLVTAAGIFGVSMEDITKAQRDVGKTCNFAILYGVSGHGLMKQINSSKEEAEKAIKGWFATYPKAEEYMIAQQQKALKKGYVTTVTNRIREFPATGPMNGSTMRKAGNTPVQGTASDITLDALIHLEKVSRGLPFNVLLTVHDSVLLEADERTFDTTVPKDVMLRAAEEIVEGTVPFKVDIKKGKNWGDMEEIE